MREQPRDVAVVSEELRRLIDDIAPTETRRDMGQSLRRELVKAAIQRGADKMLAGMAEAEQARLAAITELCPDCEATGYVRHSGDQHFRVVPA